MTILHKIRRRFRKYLKPNHLQVIADSLRNKRYPIYDDRTHLLASLHWIADAYQASGKRGVPASYSFEAGLLPSYPETSGYIIDSLLAASDYLGDASYLEMAFSLGRWEADIQLANGGVRVGKESCDFPFVFDTGMVLLGMSSLYQRRPEPWIRDFLVQASNWLVEVQGEDGLWPAFCYKNIPHAYHTKVAWALVRTARVLDDEKLLEAARKNIRAVLSLKRENGWFDLMAFTRHEPPYTHTIAYMLQGFMGIAQESPDTELNRLVVGETRAFSQKLLGLFRFDGGPVVFPGEINDRWEGNYSYTCLTGNAQLAGVFLDLFAIHPEAKYRKAGCDLIDTVKSAQHLSRSTFPTRGGIPGSFPIWGKYHPFEYPNWAPKFLIDSLLKNIAIGAEA